MAKLFMDELLMKLNLDILYLVGAALVIAVIISIFIKAAKTAILMTILAIALFFLGPKASHIQSQYNLKMTNGTLVATLVGEEFRFKPEELRKLIVEERMNGEYYAVFFEQDGTRVKVKIPRYVAGKLEEKIEESLSE